MPHIYNLQSTKTPWKYKIRSYLRQRFYGKILSFDKHLCLLPMLTVTKNCIQDILLTGISQ